MIRASPVCLSMPTKAQFPFYRLRRLKLFSGERRDDHMLIILTCWGVIGTI